MKIPLWIFSLFPNFFLVHVAVVFKAHSGFTLATSSGNGNKNHVAVEPVNTNHFVRFPLLKNCCSYQDRKNFVRFYHWHCSDNHSVGLLKIKFEMWKLVINWQQEKNSNPFFCPLWLTKEISSFVAFRCRGGFFCSHLGIYFIEHFCFFYKATKKEALL